MITSKQYLKDYKEMNEMERQGYLTRVGKWTSETFPELLALAECWEKVPVKDFDEGCLLVSAITNARPFLNDIQRYAAKVAVKKLNLYLEKVRKESGLAKRSTRGPIGVEHFRAVVPGEGVPDENGTLQTGKEFVEPEVENRRPKDFALYKDKLPKHIQEKGEKWLKDKYLELADYRGRLEVMVESPQISEAARKDIAEKILTTEQEIRAFWAEVDACLGGEETSEEEGEQSNELLSGMKRPGDFTLVEIEAMTNVEQQDMCRKARIDGNKKYINRNDVKITNEYREQLALRIRELQEWGENLPRKTADVATQAGVFIEGVNKENEVVKSEENLPHAKQELNSNTAKGVENLPHDEKETLDPTESVAEGKVQEGGEK